MRILHVMAGLGEASGVANIARRFARVQRERGDSVVLLAPTWKWNPIFFGFRFAVRTWFQTRMADEVWVHCSWTFPVWFGAWLSKRFGKKLVVVPEGSFDPKRLHNHADWKKRLVAPIDRWVLRQADEVLALCPAEITWIGSFEPTARAHFQKVPVFLEGFACKCMNTGGRPLHVLFLGRATDPLKGVRFLERAVAELNGEASPLVALRVESELFGEEKEKAWEWCDVLCLPTLSENFGLVVAEALERGKDVVTTDGAPAWEPPPKTAEVERRGGGGQWWDRLVYLRGYREGTDEERVKLIEGALREKANDHLD